MLIRTQRWQFVFSQKIIQFTSCLGSGAALKRRKKKIAERVIFFLWPNISRISDVNKNVAHEGAHRGCIMQNVRFLSRKLAQKMEFMKKSTFCETEIGHFA